MAAMLEAHARNPEASFAEGLESPSTAAAAAAAAAADTNGAGGDSSDDEAAAAAEAAAYDPVDWEAPLAAVPGEPGTVASLAAAEAAAAPWEGEEAEGSGSAVVAAAGTGGGEVFVGAAERQRLAAVAELGLRFAEAATEAGHEGEGERPRSWAQAAGWIWESVLGRLPGSLLPTSSPVSPRLLPLPQTPPAPPWACWSAPRTCCRPHWLSSWCSAWASAA